MNILEIIAILAIHWYADFVLQTDEQAQGKSKSWAFLLDHTSTYSILWFLVSIAYFITYENDLSIALSKAFIFTGITFVIHTITDYYTSRLNSKLWAAGKVHEFFVSVGFDQLLHFTQLLLTYQLLVN